MKKKLFSTSASFRASIVLMLIYAAGLAIATWVEKYHGSEAARDYIYHAPLFLLLQVLMVANFVCVALRCKMMKSRRIAFILVHVALIIILLGALVTHLFGEEGILHLREGEVAQTMVVRHKDHETAVRLPFSIELKDFILTRYPGSSSPSAYESIVTVHADNTQYDARIYMNNVLDVKGYRFFQASYDKDECGSILSVSHDVAGRNISYLGYLLLGIGLLLSLFLPGSRLSLLKRQLREIHSKSECLCLFLLLFLPVSLAAQPATAELQSTIREYAIPASHAARLSRLPVQSSGGRMMPVNTFSSEVLRKLHKGQQIYGLNSDQFLLSVLVLPDVWAQIPFIAVSDKELAVTYGLSEKYCSYAQVFNDEGKYKLQEHLERIYRTEPSQRTRLDKDVLKLDEQVNIFHQLLNRRLLNLFPLPDDPSHKWFAPGDDLSAFAGMDSMFVSHIMDWYLEETALALHSGNWNKADSILGMIDTYQQAKATAAVDIRPERMATEISYNKLRVFHHCKTGYLLVGGLALLLAFAQMFGQRKSPVWVAALLTLSVAVLLFFHACGMGLRWYVAGYAPWSNSYETIIYVGWVTVLSGLCFARRNLVVLSLGTLFGGIILFVSELNWMDPQISPLVPVLKSPWLMFHVAVVVAAYGFFGLSCLIGLTNLLLMCVPCQNAAKGELMALRIRELSLINEMSLWAGLCLMTIGTFLGAVWANESWGRYWGWDPKETWALITMVLYAVATHLHRLSLRHTIWWLNWTSVIAFSSVLMTFFGVNYLLSGMHSYGQNPHIGRLWIPLAVVAAIIVLLSFCSLRKVRKTDVKTLE